MPYPTMDEIEARLDFEVEAKLLEAAPGHLDDMIIEARHIGKAWSDENMPPVVAKAIRSAMIRWMRRPDGYTLSRSGDDHLAWSDEEKGTAGAPVFNRQEVDTIRQAAIGTKGNGVLIMSLTPHGASAYVDDGDPVYVPAVGFDRPVPFATVGEVRRRLDTPT